MEESNTDLLRHFLAALAYRSRKVIAGAPPEFAVFDRTGKNPVQIVSHMGDLLAWSLSWYGEERWAPANLDSWHEAVQRFFTLLKELDVAIARKDQLKHYSRERMLQGPLADAMTHVGQLAMMRRLAGAPTPSENFAASEMRIGDLHAPPASTSA